MKGRLLGRTGVKISSLCPGAWNLGGPVAEAEAVRMIHKALDSGTNIIDTADSYAGGESERIVGKALAGGRRSRVILAAKCRYTMSEDPNDQGNSRRNILCAVEESLRRLTPSQLALLWVKDQPGVTAPIIGPRTEAHLEDALPVMEMVLDPETAAEMDKLVPPGTAVADCHNTSGWMKMKV